MGIAISLLVERHASDVFAYAGKRAKHFGTKIETQHGNEPHDRLVIVDRDACWITEGSIKDAGRKASYLIPLAPAIAEPKARIYVEIWARAKPQP